MWHFDKYRSRLEEPAQPPLKLRNLWWCSASSLHVTLVAYSSNKQRLWWSVCTYAQVGLSLCWSHIPHCWKSHVTTQLQSHAIRARLTDPPCVIFYEFPQLHVSILTLAFRSVYRNHFVTCICKQQRLWRGCATAKTRTSFRCSSYMPNMCSFNFTSSDGKLCQLD